MCGGRGTRLESDVEKPLYEVGGRPMVDRVREALAESTVRRVHAVVSPQAPRTREHVDPPIVDAPGEGYVADLEYALERVELPVLTAAADLPLLEGEVIDRVLAAYSGGSLTVCVPSSLKRTIGIHVERTMPEDGRDLAPTGVNVVAREGGEGTVVLKDPRLAVNVNHADDARVAEELL